MALLGVGGWWRAPPNNSFEPTANSELFIRETWMLDTILPRSAQFGRWAAPHTTESRVDSNGAEKS